jgi:hypothetical protein
MEAQALSAVQNASSAIRGCFGSMMRSINPWYAVPGSMFVTGLFGAGTGYYFGANAAVTEGAEILAQYAAEEVTTEVVFLGGVGVGDTVVSLVFIGGVVGIGTGAAIGIVAAVAIYYVVH